MSGQSDSYNVIQALLFYPRGGSAQVIRYLTAALADQELNCDIISGSYGEPGDTTHAPTFFESLSVEPVDYGPALAAVQEGRDPLREPVPLHPSFEDREGVPDRAFVSVDPATAEHLETRWTAILREKVAEPPDIFHIHHLSPLQAAVRANWPDIPLIGHIHGTELKMLVGIDARSRIAEKLGLDLSMDAERIPEVARESADLFDLDEQRIVRTTRWESWRHAHFWRDRMQAYVDLCDELIVLTEDARDQVVERLGFDRSRVHPVPNGVDISRFKPEDISPEQRLQRWRQWLVDDPHGWDESGVTGSVRYTSDEISEWFLDGDGELNPVLLYVGRFMSMKRVPMLIRAYKRAQESFHRRAPLVIWGGNPGEWEYEHPVTVAREEHVSGVFFVGWRGHDELPLGLNAADVMVAPSTNEPFGQVYLEAMACRIPVVGTLSGGPPTFINRRDGEPDGWLVPPDDEAALAATMVEVVNNPEERLVRGRNALRAIQESYSWTHVAKTVQEVYRKAIESHRCRSSR